MLISILKYSLIIKFLNSRFPALLVFSGPQFHSLFVFEDMTVRRICMKSFLRSNSNIAQLTQQCTDVTAEYIGVERSSGFDSVKKVLEMHTIQDLRRIGFVARIYLDFIFHIFDHLIVQINDLVGITAPYHNETFLSVKYNTYAGTFHLFNVAAATLPNHRAVIPKLVINHLRIRCIPIIVVPVSVPDRIHQSRIVDLESPSHEIHHMLPIVERLARSPVPEPMPVVMDDVVPVRLPGCRSLPELVVEPIRNCHLLTRTDRIPVVGVPSFGKIDLADFSVVNRLNRFFDIGPGSPLVPHLDYVAILFLHLHQPFPFLRIVAGGFFQIDMFSGL